MVPKTVCGRSFFPFAIKELQLITDALTSKIETKYNPDDVSSTIEAFEERWNRAEQINLTSLEKEKEWKILIYKIRIEYCNLLYNINKEDKLNSSSDKSLPYSLFKKKWYDSFEHYIRNLYYILEFINVEIRENEESKTKYVRFVQSQMSRAELSLIEIHAQSYPLFRNILNETHLTEIGTINV